jgi:hypothetical protein
MFQEHGRSEQVVYRNIEKTLNLPGMKIHGQNS